MLATTSETWLDVYSRNLVSLKCYLQAILKDSNEVADLLQDVYIRIARSERRPQDLRSPDAFLQQVALNLVRDAARRRRSRHRFSHFPIDEVDIVDERPSPEARLLWRDALQQVVQRIATLSPDCRTALIFSRVHGASYADIAERLGISVSMVEKHISHGIRACRQFDTAPA